MRQMDNIHKSHGRMLYRLVFLCLLCIFCTISCDPFGWFRELAIDVESLPDGIIGEPYRADVLEARVKYDLTGDYYVYYSGSVEEEADAAVGEEFEMCVFRDAQQGWPSLSKFTLSTKNVHSCVGGNQVPPANSNQVFTLKYRCTSAAAKEFTIDNMAFGVCLQRATE